MRDVWWLATPMIQGYDSKLYRRAAVSLPRAEVSPRIIGEEQWDGLARIALISMRWRLPATSAFKNRPKPDYSHGEEREKIEKKVPATQSRWSYFDIRGDLSVAA
jgi:hypothetical protein